MCCTPKSNDNLMPTQNRITTAVKALVHGWPDYPAHMVSLVSHEVFCVKVRNFAHNEIPQSTTLLEHGPTLLLGIQGKSKRDRLVGYCLLHEPGATVHQYTSYCSLSYSEPGDVKFREPEVIFDDDFVRLYKFGVGVFDYFLGTRKRLAQQNVDGIADATAHLKFAGAWKDGI